MTFTNTIHFRNLRGDLFGGLTAEIVSLPLALAVGVACGAGPVAGLYGAVCVVFFAGISNSPDASIYNAYESVIRHTVE